MSTATLRAQYARNAKQLREMQRTAERTGRKYRGYTAQQLSAHADTFERLGQATDDDIRAHIASVRAALSLKCTTSPAL